MGAGTENLPWCFVVAVAWSLKRGSEFMGAERRTKVVVEDEDRLPEGQKGTRHRAAFPIAPCGARGKRHRFLERAVREDAD